MAAEPRHLVALRLLARGKPAMRQPGRTNAWLLAGHLFRDRTTRKLVEQRLAVVHAGAPGSGARLELTPAGVEAARTAHYP